MFPEGMNVPVTGLSRVAQDVLPVLYQHRLVSTSQLKTLVHPHVVGRPVWLRQQLQKLRQMDLADATVRRRARQSELLWYLTPLGLEVVEASGEVPARHFRMSAQAAASQLQEHTLATVDAGIAFVESARRRRAQGAQDECGPLHWQPEVAHRIRAGDARAGEETMLVPDAVLSYTHHDAETRRLLTYFLEIDRGTMPTRRLLAKLHAYALYRRYVPVPTGRQQYGAGSGGEAWRERYGAVFPRVLIVLAGDDAQRLAVRREDLRALVESDPRLQRAGQELLAGVTTLPQLQQFGPFDAPVVMPLFGEAAECDALLQPGARTPVGAG